MLGRLQLNVCLSKSKLPGSTRIAVTCQERQRFICLLLVLAHFDGLAQPTSTRKLGKSGGKGKTRKGKEKSPKIQSRQNEFRNDHNQTMFKKRSSEYGASRCGFHGPLFKTRPVHVVASDWLSCFRVSRPRNKDHIRPHQTSNVLSVRLRWVVTCLTLLQGVRRKGSQVRLSRATIRSWTTLLGRHPPRHHFG